MSGGDAISWQQLNQQYLGAEIAALRTVLERHAGDRERRLRPGRDRPRPTRWPDESPPPALERLVESLDLSGFERAVLLLAAGCEIDASFAALCARAQGDPQRPYPTFGLALAALPDAAWEALSPNAPLRWWRLVELGGGGALTVSPLRIDERILHHLVGVEHPDERLAGLVDPVPPPDELVPSHRELAERLAASWARTVGTVDFPVIQLVGDEVSGKRAVAAAACERLGLALCRMPADALPTVPGELENLIRLWQREAILSSSVLMLDCDEAETADAAREGAVHRFLDRAPGAMIVSGRQRRRPRERPLLTLDVAKPTTGEQRQLWRTVLDGRDGGGGDHAVEAMVAQFNLGAPTIHAAFAGAVGRVEAGADPGGGGGGDDLAAALWDTCRVQARPRLEDLAERIVPAAGWEDLVIPDPQRQVLHEIAIHLRRRGRVLETWGFAAKGTRGLGTSALFSGASGTGKTMAAEVLARELNLDLFRIDLSAVVSKYIGETEKNLRRVFGAAEEGGAILLFDEADALFGKRSEVKDSHDRHANIEVSYLLQRMESYRGLAVLTTNLRDALDAAFLRRLRFIVDFPFPNAEQRAAIWRRVFPDATPTEGLDWEKLARLNVAGGNIRNIAINAAYLAADAGQPVRMDHLLRAARAEHAKLGKPLGETEVRGWV